MILKKPSEYNFGERLEGVLGLINSVVIPFHYLTNKEEIRRDILIAQNGWAQLTKNDKLYEIVQTKLRRKNAKTKSM